MKAFTLRSFIKGFIDTAVMWLALVGLIVLDVWIDEPQLVEKGVARPTVATIVVQQHSFQDAIQLIGTVKAEQSVQLTSEVSGIVQNIYFHSGQNVVAGQLLVDLRAAEVQANLEKLLAKLAHDQKSYMRSKRLLAEQVISRAMYEEAEATVQQDQAEVRQAQALLDKYQVRAPFSGLLGIVQINVGQYLTVGQSMTTLEQLDPVYIDFALPERLLGKVHFNHEILVHSDAYPEQNFVAHLSATSNNIDVNNRSALIRLEVANPDKKLLSGMAVTISVKQDAREALVIPESAITYDPEGAIAYVIDKKNIAHRRLLTFSHQADGFAVVRDGLKPGDRLVTAGQQKLCAGLAVRINDEETL